MKISTTTLTARSVQFVGLVNLLSSLTPALHHRFAVLSDLVPTAGMVTARAATAAVGVLLIYLGAGLRRGQRRAWQLALALATLSMALHALKGLIVPTVLAAALAALLIVKRHRFAAGGDPRDRVRAWRAAALFLGTGFVVGLVLVAVHGGGSAVRRIEHVALGLLGVHGPLLGDAAVTYATGAFGMLALASVVLLLLRPSAGPAPASADETRLRETIERYGDDDSLGYFALRRDKTLVWAPSGKAAVAYRVVNGVSLASGDPIGIVSEWPQAIAAWRAECARHGWTPAVIACGPVGAKAYSKAGLDVLTLGDEAILDVPGFSLDGRSMRAVRQAVARMRRAGFGCRIVRQRDLSPAELAEVIACADALRDGKAERGYSMALSRLGDPQDGDCLLVLCHDDTGRLRGVLNFVPWGRTGLSLDLMRGDRTAPNGLTELMIVTAVEHAAAAGLTRISLNFAVLREVFARGEQLGAGPFTRIGYRALMVASRVWQLESLYRANAKFQPDWQPRYLCYPSARHLPRVTVAAMNAELTGAKS
ncbi:membrane protein [Paractinoplanes deccanensis]|uniref:Membrane protein n=1 Tax=Paractinoplanes deccanensis TaxID=113561 RepID=A0ABQ3YLL1_9ACTN|nr:phosphatidylglycerol lysyltransferase domain-containing protein [Actinoplanes deccanensis]GID80886.1 membrane protein [Actinoplanes deccanensis]